jgi:hypothetical protein
LHLIGLDRYGDKLDPNSLLNFIKELDRVMKPSSDLIFSITLRENYSSFNNGYVFDIKTIKILFNKWDLTDYLIDNNAHSEHKFFNERYTRGLDRTDYQFGNYRKIFLHFKHFE